VQPIDNSLVPPAQNLLFVDKIAVFVFAAEKQSDNGHINLLSLISLLKIEYFLLNVCSERCQACPGSHENHFLPLHRLSKGRFTKLGSNLCWIHQQIFGD